MASADFGVTLGDELLLAPGGGDQGGGSGSCRDQDAPCQSHPHTDVNGDLACETLSTIPVVYLRTSYVPMSRPPLYHLLSMYLSAIYISLSAMYPSSIYIYVLSVSIISICYLSSIIDLSILLYLLSLSSIIYLLAIYI